MADFISVDGHFTTGEGLIRSIDEAIKRSSDAGTTLNRESLRQLSASWLGIADAVAGDGTVTVQMGPPVVTQPLSQRIKPGDVLEAKTVAGTWLRLTVVRRGHKNWVLRQPDGFTDEWDVDGDCWRFAEPSTETVIHRDTKPENVSVRRHNAHCPRCYGPAYQGLGALRCERSGGCLAEREPGPTEVGQDKPFVSIATDRGERAWWVYGHSVIARAQYATREFAVAAWREAVIAKAKRESGL